MKFSYEAALKVSGWGFNFDSLTELKYAISIMDEYEFIRPAPSIYYDLSTKLPAIRVRRCHRRYTPDFLIRHRTTLQAFLVEIKPRSYQNQTKLGIYRQVAENFIRLNKYDWQFRLVFDDEIMLTQEQLEDFENLKRIGTARERTGWLYHYREDTMNALPGYLRKYMTNSKMDFLIYGMLANVRIVDPVTPKSN